MAAEQTVPAEPATEGPRADDPRIAPALLRYRVMAYVVGTLLIVLTLVAMPIKYFGHNDAPVAIIGTAHGFLYAVFLLAAFDLAVRARWRAWSTLLVLLAGTVPFLSFVAERKVTGRMRAGRRV
jgi:integral membrane protein